MLNYFKDQKSMLEFALLFLDGQNRMDVLGIKPIFFSSKKKRDIWYNEVKEVITDSKAIEKLDYIYSQF